MERAEAISEPTPISERTDEELLCDFRDQGNRDAFEQLVSRYERELYNYLRNYLGDAQLAEDVFQNTFLQIHLKSDQFQTGRKFRPWLYTIATSRAIDLQRRNRRHQAASLNAGFGDDGEEGSGSLVDLLDAQSPTADDFFDIEERREMVVAAIDALPETHKQVVLLIYYQGLKFREAADVLDIPVGTVKSRFHGALLKLNKLLAEKYDA
jgi:RNA polymerase sigma-70 factor (ECF subfamily)